MIKLQEEDARKCIETLGGRLDDDWVYINTRTKFWCMCEKNHKFQINIKNIKRGHWCPECSSPLNRQYLKEEDKKLFEDDVRKLIKSKGGKLDEDWKYINNRTRFWCVCEKGHRFKLNAKNAKKGNWCPACSHHLYLEEDIKKLIENQGGKVLEHKSRKSIHIICKNHHKFKTTQRLLLHHHWCPHCKNRRLIDENLILEFVKNKKAKLSKDWKKGLNDISCRMTLKIICEKGHEFETRWTKLEENVWCPECAQNKTESEFRVVIEQYFNKKFVKVRPDWLCYPETKYNLELDGFNEELRVAFEYNGISHYEPYYLNGYSERELQKLQRRDAFKIKRCKEENVILIIIPHWITKTVWNEEIEKQYNLAL
jgi:hypothetical protein